MPKVDEVLKTGVYYILNTMNGKRYVGSSACNLKERRARVSASLKGHTVSQMTREKISRALKQRAAALRLQQGQPSDS